MYSLSDYLWMVADGARTSAYATALRAVIRPGDRVLDVGTGFGFFSVIAARAGAAHVDAVDTNPVIHLGARIAAANDCADRITFHHRDVATLELPEPADVLLIDVRGPTPFGSRSLEALIAARDRLLRADGRIIAQSDRVLVAPARTPAVFLREVHAAHGRENVDLGPVERIIFDTPVRCTIDEQDLLAPGACWVALDYSTVTSTDAAGSLRWPFDRAITIDGLALWFDADLADGIALSTRPGGTVAAYRQMFIPFRTPVAVTAGDTFGVELSARQLREHYLWAWRGWICRSGSAEERIVLDQNSLAEIVLDSASLPHTSADAIPALGPRGSALRELLGRIDGRRSVAVLVNELLETGTFGDRAAAQDFVAIWTARLARHEHGQDQS